jgi:hypothetical protein
MRYTPPPRSGGHHCVTNAAVYLGHEKVGRAVPTSISDCRSGLRSFHQLRSCRELLHAQLNYTVIQLMNGKSITVRDDVDRMTILRQSVARRGQ